MKLIVTVGNADNYTEELVFNVPEPITWLGVEIEDNRPEDQRNMSGRMTILRQPFVNHGLMIHTLCTPFDEIHQVIHEGVKND